MVRQEFVIQGLTGVNAYDGRNGWKIEPWGGKKDAEELGEDELKSILEESDFDGPLVNYREKGNTVEYVGLEPVEGTDAIKLKVSVPNGDVYLLLSWTPTTSSRSRSKPSGWSAGPSVNSKPSWATTRKSRGCTSPSPTKADRRGAQFRSKLAYETIDANTAIDDARFSKPAVAPAPAGK